MDLSFLSDHITSFSDFLFLSILPPFFVVVVWELAVAPLHIPPCGILNCMFLSPVVDTSCDHHSPYTLHTMYYLAAKSESNNKLYLLCHKSVFRLSQRSES